MSRLSSMSIRPGQERDVAEVDLGRRPAAASAGSTATMRLPSTTIAAGERTSPATTSTQRAARRTVEVAVVGHGTGSTTQSKVAEPVSGTFGWPQHSTGNDTWIIE